ncbi:MAG TPA: hypothetical protein VNA69_24770 [Thermoanaerobaculia bacterium]|nr:hypothetical protein [Thermoanaerobaculia bacterium]
MRRLKYVVVIALAVILASQLVLHNHALFHERMAPPCSVCAFGADPTVATPVLTAPLGHAWTLTSAVVLLVPGTTVRTLPSRAPPRL